MPKGAASQRQRPTTATARRSFASTPRPPVARRIGRGAAGLQTLRCRRRLRQLEVTHCVGCVLELAKCGYQVITHRHVVFPYSAPIIRRNLFKAASPDFESSLLAARALASAVVNDTVTPLTTAGTILISPDDTRTSSS